MLVEHEGPIVGKTIAEAGLRDMQYGFLSEIQSEGRIISAVGPEEVLSGGDILVFVGQPEAVTELRQLPGLRTAEKELLRFDIQVILDLLSKQSSPQYPTWLGRPSKPLDLELSMVASLCLCHAMASELSKR
jgi:hypothetical protein